MKIFNKLILLLAIMPFMSFVSCNKEEGEGGKATITGKVYKIVDGGDISNSGDNYTFVRDTVLASDVDVFIIYGGDKDDVYDDKTKTSHNGKYEFEYLREGDYSLFAYNDNDSYEMRSVHCDKKGTTEVEPIYILEGKNTGKCGVVGSVEIQYSAELDMKPGVAVRVYIRKDGQMSVSDTRTDDNGNYYFSRLEPKSKYIVWVEHEDKKNTAVKAQPITVETGKAGEIVKCELLQAKTF